MGATIDAYKNVKSVISKSYNAYYATSSQTGNVDSQGTQKTDPT